MLSACFLLAFFAFGQLRCNNMIPSPTMHMYTNLTIRIPRSLSGLCSAYPSAPSHARLAWSCGVASALAVPVTGTM
ncbi:hypothetical protein B0T25DRAFT_31739 [Lasiosphaeria hispida]|uniref:Secreted protein n=1 Tax=Lasiosphaeria hispida TaxID=260671 RepID=A0AAJ0MJV1_9PEZI|nr:hypothetical protein B0T25DRAFT_31739 [Lasiosphaeria hispida]